MLPTLVLLGFPCGSAGKEYPCNSGDLGLSPGLGRSPGEWNSYSLQYSGLEISMDCRVYGVAKSWTLLSDFHFHFPAVCSAVGMLDHMVALFLVFSGTSILFSIVTVQCTFSPTLWEDSLFSTPSPACTLYRFFWSWPLYSVLSDTSLKSWFAFL